MARTMGRVPALLSGYILATTSPMIFIHGARSGDYSPLFTFMVLLFILCLFKSEKNPSYLYIGGFVFALSFLVYSFAAFQLLVLALVYLALTEDYRKILMKNYLGFILFAFLPIGAWALWRFSNADGAAFLSGMVSYDLFKRATQPLEGHAGNFDYYFVSLAKGDSYWFIFMSTVLLSYLAAIGFKLNTKNRLFTLSALGVVVPLILFSFARTKLGWYLIPSYPPFAIAVGCLTWSLLNDRRVQTAGKAAVLFVFLIVALRAEREIQKQILRPEQETAQIILMDFKKTGYLPNTALYTKGLSQAQLFVAEVACGLNPLTVKDFAECLNKTGYLMLGKDKKTTESQDFAVAHKLSIVLQDDDWMIVKL